MIDQVQLSDLFATHAARLVLYARQWLDLAAAEDVVQEVFVQLLQQRTPPTSAKAWLYRAVRNQAVTHFRADRRRQGRERKAADRQAWFLPETSSQDLLVDAAAVKAALEQLPIEQREVLVLRIWGQMKLNEIAELTDSATSTVFDRYRAGLAALRKTMGAESKEGVSCKTIDPWIPRT